MFCRLVRNRLMDYYLEELSERGDRLVEWHLRSCERCRAESRELVNLLNALQHHMEAEWHFMPIEESWERVAQRQANRAPSSPRLSARMVATGAALAVVAGAWFAFAPGRQGPGPLVRVSVRPQASYRRAPGRTTPLQGIGDTAPSAAGHVVAVDHGSGTITVAAANRSALAIGQRLRTAPPQQAESADPTISITLLVAKHRGAGRYQCRVVGPTAGLSRVRPGWSVHLQDGDHPKPNSR